MSRSTHLLYISILSLIVLFSLVYLIYMGYSYYNTSIEERFFHEDHTSLKPSGIIGHGLGIVGSLFMMVGVTVYMLRKRMRSLSRLGLLKHWLEFHIFLCTLGPVMVLFHTAFKFGGLVAISFWSMVAVFLSGVIGRFIYIQIPRSIEGRELSLGEIRNMKGDVTGLLKQSYDLGEEDMHIITESTKRKVERYHSNIFSRVFMGYFDDRRTISQVKSVLRKHRLSRAEMKQVLGFVRNEISINRKIEGLATMQNLFRYWHVAHLPFALVMLIIMIIHVIVTVVLGFKWIF